MTPGQDASPPVAPRFDRWSFVLLAGFAAIAGLVAAIGRGVPLLPKQSDSGWYFAGVRYMETGTYLWESFYPSFAGPSQYYPLGGYSLVLLGAREFASLIGADWVSVVRVAQLSAYLVTGALVYAIAKRFAGRKTGAAAALLYFAWFPFLNYAVLVMSETFACLLLTAVVFLLLDGLARARRGALFLSFFLAGWAVLFKSVLLAVLPLLLAAAVIYDWNARRWGTWALLAAALAACPAAQAIANHFVYGNFRVVGGLGLHLCNRLLLTDKSIPVSFRWPSGARPTEYVPVEVAKTKGSPALRRLAEDVAGRAPRYVAVDSARLARQLAYLGVPAEKIESARQAVPAELRTSRDVKFVPIETALASDSPAFRRLAEDLAQRRLQSLALGAWWDIGEQLSALGYDQNQVEDWCRDLSVDALLDNKAHYVLNTFAMAMRILFSEKDVYASRVHPTQRENLAWLTAFGAEPMHRPLGEELVRGQQELLAAGSSDDAAARLYAGFAGAFASAQALGLQAVISGAYLLWSLLVVVQTLRAPSRQQILPLVIALLPALVVVGSCATEAFIPRYRLPVEPLMLVAFCLLVSSGSARLLGRPGRRAGAAPPRTV